jgi:hypothetical protein
VEGEGVLEAEPADLGLDVVDLEHRRLRPRLGNEGSELPLAHEITLARQPGQDLVHRHPRHAVAVGEVGLERQPESRRPLL